MIDQVELMTIVEKYRGDAVVIPTMRANKGWAQVTANERRDLPTGGAMGKSSAMGLGIALARPDTKVILFDGDGSLEMCLGSMATIAGKTPKNLYHFILQNRMYATTGGQPIPGSDAVSFVDMASAAGYAASYYFDDLEEFASNAERILNEDGPVMICVETVPEIRLPQDRVKELGSATRSATQAVVDLKEELGSA